MIVLLAFNCFMYQSMELLDLMKIIFLNSDAVDCLNIMPSTNLTHIGLEEMVSIVRFQLLAGVRFVNSVFNCKSILV